MGPKEDKPGEKPKEEKPGEKPREKPGEKPANVPKSEAGKKEKKKEEEEEELEDAMATGGAAKEEHNLDPRGKPRPAPLDQLGDTLPKKKAGEKLDPFTTINTNTGGYASEAQAVPVSG